MEQNFPGGRKIIRQAFLKKGTPPAAIETTIASIRDTTISQYEKPLRLWWQFCKKRNISIMSPLIPRVLKFLSSYLANTGSYSTLNTYRSAISLIFSDEVVSHPLIKRFFRDVAALKPQRPRYDFIWDPSLVIAHLATLYPYETLSLELVSKKLVTLLALTTAQRIQTLAAIQYSNIKLSDSIVIKIPARLKTSEIGRSQPVLVFKPFLDKPELCVFSLTKQYLTLTQGLRQSNCDSFFITFRKPHNSVSAQTLGRWVKTTLEN